VLNPNIWRSQQRDFHWQGLRVGFHDEGQGPALLLLHGLPGSSWDWHRLWPMLAGQFRLICPDLPGCGDSDKPSEYSYRLQDQAQLVSDLLGHLNIRQCQIIGHDYGASLGRQLLKSPGDIEFGRCSWIAARRGGEARYFLWRELWLAGPLGPLLSHCISEGLYGRYLETLSGPFTPISSQTRQDLWQLLCAHQGLQVLPQLLHYRYELPLSRETSMASSNTQQYIDGEYDPLSRHSKSYGALRVKTGHFPHLEDAEHLAMLLTDFHRDNDAGSQAVFQNLLNGQ
jgi:pimeloyl-ACP methyl ester carboxylesterase